MGKFQSRRFDEADEVIQQPNLDGQVVALGETFVGRYVHHVGWRWSTDVKPVVGTDRCRFHHRGISISGRLHVVAEDGTHNVVGPGEAFDIPPGHDAWVEGDEPWVSYEFVGARDWSQPRTAGERVLATLVFTDIVGSTTMASRLGDAAWRQLLSNHYTRLRNEVDRYRGLVVKTTGDGLLAMFDGTERAVRCAMSLCEAARRDGLEVRVGVHAGEVERRVGDVEGVAVHVAARIMAMAGAGEVFLSASTVALLEGAGLAVEDRGEHELRGLDGRRRVYSLREATT